MKILIVLFFILGIIGLSFVNSEAFASTLIHTLTEPDPATDRKFGGDVDTDGKYVLIGAHHSYKIQVGKVYLYDAASGNLLHTFTSPITTPDCNSIACEDFFGIAVAIDGNNILIGAPEDGDSNGQGGGSVYQYDATTYNLIRKIADPIPQVYDNFGNSVAIDGNNIIIGEGYGSTIHLSEQAYIFDATTGEHLHTLVDPSPQVGSQFGYSVTIDGDIAVVGSWGDSFGTTNEAGSVFVYSVSTGNFIKTINNPEPKDFDYYGFDVAIDGTNLVVGSWLDEDDTGTNNGKVYFHNASSGSQVHSFTSPGNDSDESFGESVSTSNDQVLIGSPGERVIKGNPAQPACEGKAYLHDFSTGNLLETFDNPSLTCDYFGTDVAISSNYIVIGAEDWGVTDIGAAYIYDRYPGEFLYEGSISVDTPHNGVMPLQDIAVEIDPVGASKFTIRPDENGAFSFVLPDGITMAAFGFTLKDSTPKFFVSGDTTEGMAATIVTGAINADANPTLNFVLGQGKLKLNGALQSITSTNLFIPSQFSDLSIIYAHSFDYVNWSEANLPTTITGLEVQGRIVNSGCDYFSSSIVFLCAETIDFENAKHPWYNVWILGHEFGHFIEYKSLIGGKDNLQALSGTDSNHQGYNNTDSIDSVSEGWGTFLGLVMREKIYSKPPTQPASLGFGFTNFEKSVLAPGVKTGTSGSNCGFSHFNTNEEFAVSTILWDLYDNNQENSSDTGTKTIAQIWSVLNSTSLSTIDSMYGLLDAAGYDINGLFQDSYIYVDANNNCTWDFPEVFGTSQWEVHNPPPQNKKITYASARSSSPPVDFRNLVAIQILHNTTNEPLDDVDITPSLQFDSPNQFLDTEFDAFTQKSPYVFNSVLGDPGQIHLEFEKDGVTAFTDITFVEFWNAYSVSPILTQGVLFTKTVKLDLGSVSPPSCAPPVSGDWIVNQDCIVFLDVSAPANVIVQNNSLLTISGGSTVNVDFENFSLMVNSNSGVLIKSGAQIT